MARTVPREFLLSVGDKSFYESVNFSDAALLDIFDFNYIHGDATALQDPSGLVLTESSAIKYFGHTDVMNETITFDNEFDFHVTGVIADVPLNSHFSSSVIGESELNFIAPISGLNRMRDWDLAGNWNNLSIGNMTYVLLPETLGEEWLATQVEGIFERLVPDEQKQVLSALTVTPLQRANLAVWDMIGMPVIAVVSLLSFLVLIVACVNYTNLATAQSLGRSREVGMRKTMGASQLQLLAQFLIESLVIASLAMIVAIAALELMIPLFNNARQQESYTRLSENLALAGPYNRAGGPDRGHVPGVADYACEPYRCAAGSGKERQERRPHALGHDWRTICDLGLHAGGRVDRLYAERESQGIQLHLPSFRDLYDGSPVR